MMNQSKVNRRVIAIDDGDNNSDGSAASSGPQLIKINVSHGPIKHLLSVPAQSTFGDLKGVIAKETGLDPKEQKILFRGKEIDDDDEQLDSAGVRDKSKVMVYQSKGTQIKEAQQTEDVNQTEELKPSEETLRALEKIAGVRSAVDKLSQKVSQLKVSVDNGTKVSDREFDTSSELLMRELLKLDGIEAEGEARAHRKAEVRRVQQFQEALDKLKVRNANTSVTTNNWETFDSGEGPDSLQSSTKVSKDWEEFN
ncbi:hypothetical protein ACFE04_002485 [Oxalis oulophora]